MSLTARRTLSWLLTLALVVAVAAGVSRLPGTGGLVAELHWLLQRDQPQALNRAGLLILLANQDDRTARASLFARFLGSDDPREVNGALAILATTADRLDDATYAAILHWFDHATTEVRVRHLPHSLVGLSREPSTWPDALPDWSPHSPQGQRVAQDPRWLVAATLRREEPARSLAKSLAFRASAAANPIGQRIDALDERSPAPRKRPELLDVKPLPVNELSLQLAIPAEALHTMLNDSIPEVRMGAGRILAVAGDQAALPTFGEWLQRERGSLPPAADKLLTDLYGPDWRTLCESRGATSPPGPRDGR